MTQCVTLRMGHFSYKRSVSPLEPVAPLRRLTQSSAREMVTLSRFLAVSAFVGLASAAPNSTFRAACQAVEAAISTASDVYYWGEYG